VILILSVRLLDDRFHGLSANGEQPNWPPSCFRLFQAIVAGNAKGESIPPNIAESLKWLESLRPPVIIVPPSQEGKVMLTYVLNNTEERRRTQKFIRPTLLHGDRLIEFAWEYDPAVGEAQGHAKTLLDAVRHVRSFGWGVDLAIGHGVIVDRLPELSKSRIHFVPREDPDSVGIDVRVPRIGSLESLQDCYRQYLARFDSNEATVLESSGPLYQPWPYTAGVPRPCVVFKLLDDDLDTTRYPQALLTHIAAVVRHAAIDCMEEGRNAPSWMLEAERGPWVSRFVRGKKELQHDSHEQISYVPLPSIGHEHSDAMIRNVMLIAPIGHERELEYVAERLDGVRLEFKDAGEECDTDMPPGSALPYTIQRFTPLRGKFIDKCYLGRSTVWQSVTPVILDEHIHKKTQHTEGGRAIKYRDPEDFERLIVLALQRAGIEMPCKFTWQTLPFYKNCLTAHRYDRNKRVNYLPPKHLDGRTAVHMQLHFDHPVPGPITLGAGRHCGFGLFAVSEIPRNPA
jgi:CRISPR-associated protein Csb2